MKSRPSVLGSNSAVEDLIVKDDPARGGKHVAGAVTNWTLVSLNHDTQMCM